MIKRIIFIGDLLRCQNDVVGFADRSLGWEYYILKEQIFQATGIMPEVYYTDSTEKFDLYKFYELCGYEVSMENWINIACGNYSAEAKEYVKECFKDALIITQVGGSLLKVIEELNIPYIDIYVSAFKFLEDIHFAFRSNVKEIREKLKKYTYDEEYLYIYANYMKAYYWADKGRKNYSIEPNSLLLLGQTDVDLSLIKDNKLVYFMDYENDLRELCSKFDVVYYKPHPYVKPNSINEMFISGLDNVSIINANFYRLMLEENIVATAALSSGTLSEAKYFGKKSHYISHKFVNYCFDNNPSEQDFILINDEYYSPVFWSDILSPVFKTKKCKPFAFQNKSNVLRNSLGTSWGYDITTNTVKDLRNKINEVNKILTTKKVRFKTIRRILSCLMPIRSIRRKIRGDII